MSENEKDFLSEWIEQPIGDASSLDTAEEPLLQSLQRSYQTYARENRASLERVQERLATQLHRSHFQESSSQHGRMVRVNNPLPDRKTGWSQVSRTLNTIAAVLFVALLVGGMTLMIVSRKNGWNGDSSAPSSPGMYMVTAKDGSTNAAMSKVDIGTHQIVWSYTNPKVSVGSPTVADGAVYFTGTNTANSADPVNGVYALDANRGRLLWETDLSPSGQSTSFIQPIYANGSLYTMATGTGKVTALDARSGKIRWTYESKTSSQADNNFDNGQLDVSDDTVYGILHNKLFALDVSTGEDLWPPVQIAADHFFQGLHLENNVLYTAEAVHDSSMGDPKIAIYAFNAGQGTQIWRYHSTDAIDPATPVFAGGNIYFQTLVPVAEGGQWSSGDLYALSAQGTEIWHKSLNKPDQSSFVISHDLLYLYDSTYDARSNVFVSSTLEALHTNDGSVAWSKPVEISLVPDGKNILCVNGMLYNSTTSGQLVTYDATTGKQLYIGGSPLQKSDYVAHMSVAGPLQMGNGVLYAGADPFQVIAYAADTGRVLWHTPSGVSVLDFVVVP